MNSQEENGSPHVLEMKEMLNNHGKGTRNVSNFADMFFQAVLGAQMIQSAYIGMKLGWYNLLRDASCSSGDRASARSEDSIPHEQNKKPTTTVQGAGLTPSELAARSGNSSARYAREWLEQHAVAGWLTCTNPTEPDPNMRRFVLPTEHHVAVLADVDSQSYMLPLAQLLAGSGRVIDDIVHAYQSDTGVSWSRIGNDARDAQAAISRPFFLQTFPSILEDMVLDKNMATKFLACSNTFPLPDDDDEKKKKEEEESVDDVVVGRVADIGAGYAWSSVGIAKHFPNVVVDAFDLDEVSVQRARKIVEQENVQERVTVYCADAADLLVSKSRSTDHEDDGENNSNKSEFVPYDLVLALECIHDLSDPISVLRTMRLLAGDSGKVIVMDENVKEHFVDGINDPLEQLMYGFSCTCCLVDGKSHDSPSSPSAATGTVMRPSILRAYAQQAGFRDIKILPVNHDTFRFYELF